MPPQNPKHNFFFFLTNEGVQRFSSIWLFPWVYAVPLSHTHQVITERNPMGVARRCWQEVLSPESHGYHEALGTWYGNVVARLLLSLYSTSRTISDFQPKEWWVFIWYVIYKIDKFSHDAKILYKLIWNNFYVFLRPIYNTYFAV